MLVAKDEKCSYGKFGQKLIFPSSNIACNWFSSWKTKLSIPTSVSPVDARY